jgi:predicted nucleic acid-binding protein
MSLAQAVQAASIIDELGLVFDRGDAKVASLLAAADTHGLTAYDALYLELAIRTGARLLTADRALQAAASRAGVQ